MKVSKQKVLSIEPESLCKGWTFSTIEDMIGEDGVFSDGDWVESKDQDPTGDVRLIQLADIGDGSYRDRSNRFLTRKKAVQLKCTFLTENDVLIARMPDPLGRACIFPGDPKDSVTVVDVCIVRTGESGVNHRWLMFATNSLAIRTAIASLQSGSTRKRISRKNLGRILYPVSPLPEQRRIVAKIEELFTKLDAGVEALKKIRRELKRYRQAVLKYAFEGKLTAKWREKNKDKLEPASKLLERIAKEREKSTKGKRQKKLPPLETSKLTELPKGWEWAASSLMFKWANGKGLTRKNLIDGDFFVYGGNGVTGKHNKYLCEQDSIVIGRVGANCGNVHIAPPKSWITDNAIYSVWKSSYIISKFFLCLLSSMRLNELSGGSGQPYVSQLILNPLPLRVPPLLEQQQIFDEIERHFSIADQIEQTIEQSLKQSKRLRQSILKKAFEGKLVPQDPEDEPAEKLLERIKNRKNETTGGSGK